MMFETDTTSSDARRIDQSSLVHWLIRDCDDGSERTTQCVKQTTWSYRGLRRTLCDQVQSQKEVLRAMWMVSHGVCQKEPILLVAIIANTLIETVQPIIQLFCKLRILMLTQAAFEGSSVDCSRAVFYVGVWLACTLFKMAASSRLAFFTGRFKVLYNLAVEQSILDAAAQIGLELRETQKTKDLLAESQKLTIPETDKEACLVDTIITITMHGVTLPIRMATIISLTPRSCAPLLLILAVYWLCEAPIYNLIAFRDWTCGFETVSLSNPNLIRMKRLFDIGINEKFAKDVQLLGIGPYVRDAFRSATLSLDGSVSSKRKKLDVIDKAAKDEILYCLRNGVQLALVAFLARDGALSASSSVGFALVEHTSWQIANELRVLSTLNERLGRRMQQFDALTRLTQVASECMVTQQKSKDLPVLDTPQPGLSIQVRNVSFSYPNQQQKSPVLRNLSFNIPAGSLVAVVGWNGAGKSSLISVLSRAYDVHEGAVLVNGVDIKMLNSTQLAGSIAVLPQSAELFNVSLKENIAWGDCDNENIVRRAAQAAGARTFVEQLPQQYDSCTASSSERLRATYRCIGLQPVTPSDCLHISDENGKPLTSKDRSLIPEDMDMSRASSRQEMMKYISHEHPPGIRLSGGELQKIVLSRAFAKESQLCIFDEPASNLDPESESELFKQIAAIKGRKTIIYISHRWKGITDHADLVLLMEDGQVKEEGNHAKLMADNGAYARLWRLQTESEGLAVGPPEVLAEDTKARDSYLRTA